MKKLKVLLLVVFTFIFIGCGVPGDIIGTVGSADSVNVYIEETKETVYYDAFKSEGDAVKFYASYFGITYLEALEMYSKVLFINNDKNLSKNVKATMNKYKYVIMSSFFTDFNGNKTQLLINRKVGDSFYFGTLYL